MKLQLLGLGNLGLFLASHFLESGFEVSGWDINPQKRIALESLGGCWCRDGNTDAVLLSLFPEQISAELLEGFSLAALLINVSSVQQPGLEALKKAGVEGRRVLSFHPLFGPVGVTQSGWTGKQLIVTVQPQVGKEADNAGNTSRGKIASELLDTFIRKGVMVDRMSPVDHDGKMLLHALAFLIAELVKTGGEGADPRFLTGSGRQLLGLLDFTEAGSPALRHLILSNPALKLAVPKLRKTLDELSKDFGWSE